MVEKDFKMKIEKLNELKRKLASGLLTRMELDDFRANVLSRLDVGDEHRSEVELAFENAKPSDWTVIFMGFCPDAQIKLRLDGFWKERGICEFKFDESESQVKEFNQIRMGDLVVLKKVQLRGKTMRLYGHGRVSRIRYSGDGRRVLDVRWSANERVIEVPLIGCNRTVNRKAIKLLIARMPQDFHDWLEYGGDAIA
jgi:hypothetical protein